jgi:TRAP-type C4-dicarboxylate transport system permease small subunit
MDLRMMLVWKTVDAVNRACFLLGAAMIASIAAIYCYEVGARYLFDAPTEWSSLVSSLMFSVGTFLVIPEVTRRGAHVAVDILLQELRGPARRWLARVLMIVSSALCGVACAVTAVEAHRQFASDINIMSTLIVPKWIVTVFMPFGFAGAAVYFLRAAVGQGDAPRTDPAPKV